MAASLKFPVLLFLSSLFLHASLASEIVCEDLGKEVCAFAISTSGKRCLLETYAAAGGEVEMQCRTSEIMVERMPGHIETDDCVNACGVDRTSAGISSDSLLEPNFTAKLCSPDCYSNCPNIVDLYFNLAAGEGAFLPEICKESRNNPHRSMIQLMSSGSVAVAPSTAEDLTAAAAEAPSPM
ncbi:unnamed protein product [Linum trigynum]|uniref:PAR1 protein n=1 Tax=Linum trigynum TaxID=586398 RepID=A0AAV2DZ21_9ROSI